MSKQRIKYSSSKGAAFIIGGDKPKPKRKGTKKKPRAKRQESVRDILQANPQLRDLVHLLPRQHIALVKTVNLKGR